MLTKYRGVEVNVNSDGEFGARVGTDYLQADTLKALKYQIDKARAKQRVTVNVPYSVLGQVYLQRKHMAGSWISGHGVRHMEAVSRRLDGNLMVRDVGGKLEQQDRFSNRDVARRLTPAEVEEYVALRKAMFDAQEAYHAFIGPLKLDLDKAVTEAIAAKTDAVDTDAEEIAGMAEDLDPR